MFGLANAVMHGASSGASGASGADYTVGQPASVNPGEYVYGSGNNPDKIGFFPNEAGTQYSSYASYDANLDNRAKFLDRESKGLIQPQQPQYQQPQQ
jgi:hypothetical protein